MKKTIEVIHTVTCTIEIEDNKIEDILKEFREYISTEANVDDLFYQIAYSEVVCDSDFATFSFKFKGDK